jgi:hypothetical protein
MNNEVVVKNTVKIIKMKRTDSALHIGKVVNARRLPAEIATP